MPPTMRSHGGCQAIVQSRPKHRLPSWRKTYSHMAQDTFLRRRMRASQLPGRRRAPPPSRPWASRHRLAPPRALAPSWLVVEGATRSGRGLIEAEDGHGTRCGEYAGQTSIALGFASRGLRTDVASVYSIPAGVRGSSAGGGAGQSRRVRHIRQVLPVAEREVRE